MALFKDMLGNDESLFLNPEFLDFDYQPKLVPFRENHQKYIAECIRPLIEGRRGKNILVQGTPGVGKTVCIHHVLKELDDDFGAEIYCLYVNCWKMESPYRIISSLCEQVGYKWVQSKRVEELVKAFAEIVNKKRCVIVFDEADKIDDQGIVYTLAESIYKSCFMFVTNDSDFASNLDARLKSRLGLAALEFDKYKMNEVFEILSQRKDYVFVNGVWDAEAFKMIASKTYEYGDIRTGLQMMKDAGEAAESGSSRKILIQHSKSAIEKLKRFDSLEGDDEQIYRIAYDNSGSPMGEIFRRYELSGGKKSYRTFQRKITALEKQNKLRLKETDMGFYGRTRIVEKL